MPSNRDIRLAPEAEEDIRDIVQYTLDTWGEHQRDIYAAVLTEGLARIKRFPEIGSVVARPRASLRRYRVRHHVIYYEIGETEIRIVRVLHARMDATRQRDR